MFWGRVCVFEGKNLCFWKVEACDLGKTYVFGEQKSLKSENIDFFIVPSYRQFQHWLLHVEVQPTSSLLPKI